MSALVENLAAFCREHPLEEKVLVVRSRLVGRQITDSLARAMAPEGWVNLRAETAGTLAHAVVGEEMGANGRTWLSRAQTLAIVEKVCHDTLAVDSYFWKLKDFPGFHRVLSRTIEELRAAGIGAGGLGGDSLESRAKGKDLRALLEAYETEIRERFIDGAGLLHRAIEKLRAEGAARNLWVLLPNRPEVETSEREFLTLLGGERLVSLDTDNPEKWRHPGVKYEFFRALGEENELRKILRRAMAQKIPADQIEILYTQRDEFLPLAWELTQQYGIPATFADRVNVVYTRPGRAALGFLDWIGSGFEERILRRVISAGDFDLEKLSSSDSMNPQTAARILRNARIGWGRDRYLTCLNALEASERRRRDAEGDEEVSQESRRKELDAIDAVKNGLTNLLKRVPDENAAGKCSQSALAKACKGVVEVFAANSSELDGIALKALPPVLEDVAFLEREPVPIAEAAQRVREALSDLYVGGAGLTYAQPGKVHFAGFEDGGYTGRPFTFLVGMDESKFPGAGLQDPVLLDAERRRLNSALLPQELPLRGMAPEKKAEALRSCLARLRGTVTISYSCFELLEGREEFPAGMLLEIYRRAIGDDSVDQNAMLDAFGEPDGFVPDPGDALDDSEWWMGRIAQERTRPQDAAAAVQAEYPWLEEGRRAREERASDRFTIYDGHIPSAGSTLDPRESGEVVSASRLEMLADCPFRYFLKYVLGLEAPEEIDRDRNVWLDSRSKGSLLHELFKDFMEEMKRRGERAAWPEGLSRITQMAEEKLLHKRGETPPFHEAAFLRSRKEILEAAATFLRSESEETGDVAPMFFEVSFGRPGNAGECPGAGEDPITLSLGGASVLRVRGSIDRIDRQPGGAFEVWDYKSGRAGHFDARKKLDGGRRLQHSLYASVFEAIAQRGGFEAKVERGGYVFIGRGGNGERREFDIDRKSLQRTLMRLCDVLREGAFVHGAKKEECCAFCELEAVCGGKTRAAHQAARKLDNPGNTVLSKVKMVESTEEKSSDGKIQR